MIGQTGQLREMFLRKIAGGKVLKPSKSQATEWTAAMAGKGLAKIQLLFDQFAEDMTNENMRLLDSSGGI